MLGKTLTTAAAIAVTLGIAVPARAETHWNLQAVDDDGIGTWPATGTTPVTIEGLLLNDPAAMLDGTPSFLPWEPDYSNAWNLGAQWQIFVQPTDPADHAGTACWMGQNYGNITWHMDSGLSYTDAEWQAEVDRLTLGGALGKGDRIRVTANVVGFHGGKTNVNEGHDNDRDQSDPDYPDNPAPTDGSGAHDFTIEILEPGYGLPAAETITLADLEVDPATPGYDAGYPRFDASRQSGGEYYQGRRVRIDGLALTDASGWGELAWGDRLCTATDGLGRQFSLRMPRFDVLDLGAPPTGEFSAIGIFNQEGGNKDGYELFVQETLAGGPGVAEVPEPACGAVLALAAGTWTLWKRRRRNT